MAYSQFGDPHIGMAVCWNGFVKKSRKAVSGLAPSTSNGPKGPDGEVRFLAGEIGLQPNSLHICLLVPTQIPVCKGLRWTIKRALRPRRLEHPASPWGLRHSIVQIGGRVGEDLELVLKGRHLGSCEKKTLFLGCC